MIHDRATHDDIRSVEEHRPSILPAWVATAEPVRRRSLRARSIWTRACRSDSESHARRRKRLRSTPSTNASKTAIGSRGDARRRTGFSSFIRSVAGIRTRRRPLDPASGFALLGRLQTARQRRPHVARGPHRAGGRRADAVHGAGGSRPGCSFRGFAGHLRRSRRRGRQPRRAALRSPDRRGADCR